MCMQRCIGARGASLWPTTAWQQTCCQSGPTSPPAPCSRQRSAWALLLLPTLSHRPPSQMRVPARLKTVQQQLPWLLMAGAAVTPWPQPAPPHCLAGTAVLLQLKSIRLTLPAAKRLAGRAVPLSRSSQAPPTAIALPSEACIASACVLEDKSYVPAPQAQSCASTA